MNPQGQPMTVPSATNGLSSTTNGDASAYITSQTQSQHHSQLQSGNPDKVESISAGMSRYTRRIARH